jgi:AcrR family transcriptional regulator
MRLEEQRAAAKTRERILQVALELFAQHGYAATSVADLAARLGTSKAALYYHFRSKEELLDELLSSSLSGFMEIAERAASGLLPPEELIGAIIDLTTISGALRAAVSTDPSAMSALLDRAGPKTTEELTDQIISALAGDQRDEARVIAAQAAFTVARYGTISVLQSADSLQLSPDAREELLAAALRALRR